uniref:Protein kinase domain-containing protein n=1 Tax=Panagrolaimus sp. JU765 TaxID=591449 RepID=A0AC34Q8S0_9BILA
MGCINSKCDLEADGRRLNMIREIAQGGFSIIYLAKDIDSGDKLVVKKMECHSNNEIERTKREIKIHESFGTNDNILQILGATEIKISDGISRFYLIFPYRHMGSLQNELDKRAQTKEYFTLSTVILIFSQICHAVRCLHHYNPPLIHRDLKPANVLFVDENHVELTDFGSCVVGPITVKDGKHSRYLIDDAGENSTMTYRAPELFNCDVGTVLNQSIDIWSLGCVLYAICYFKSPFDEAYEKGDSVPLAAMSGRVKFPSNTTFGDVINNVILQLLKADPSERPDIDSVVALMESLKSDLNIQNNH